MEKIKKSKPLPWPCGFPSDVRHGLFWVYHLRTLLFKNYPTILEKGNRWQLFPRPGHFYSSGALSQRGMPVLWYSPWQPTRKTTGSLQGDNPACPFFSLIFLVFCRSSKLYCWGNGRLVCVAMEINLENVTACERNPPQEDHLLCKPVHKKCLHWAFYNDRK